MPTLISRPTRIEAAGSKPKIIEEYVGRVNTSTQAVSVARMRSPEGWEEPGQTPEFDEYTVVLLGTLRVQHKSGELGCRGGARQSSRIAENGFAIRLHFPAARNISRFACRHSHRRACIGTSRPGSANRSSGLGCFALWEIRREFPHHEFLKKIGSGGRSNSDETVFKG